MLHLDTESDLWQARSSLIVTDTSGTDIAMPDEVRVYTVSGVSHAPFRPLSKPVMQLPGNRLGYGAFMRALLVALFEWVEHGVAPPNSRFPSRADGTLVTLAESRAKFPKLPQVNFPNVLNELRLRDHSVEPPIESIAYPVFVQMTDADGNALGGIRHPMVDAPLATHTGWSLRASAARLVDGCRTGGDRDPRDHGPTQLRQFRQFLASDHSYGGSPGEPRTDGSGCCRRIKGPGSRASPGRRPGADHI